MSEPSQARNDWSKTEQWVWARIASGQAADLNERDRGDNPEFEDLVPDHDRILVTAAVNVSMPSTEFKSAKIRLLVMS